MLVDYVWVIFGLFVLWLVLYYFSQKPEDRVYKPTEDNRIPYLASTKTESEIRDDYSRAVEYEQQQWRREEEREEQKRRDEEERRWNDTQACYRESQRQNERRQERADEERRQNNARDDAQRGP